MDRNLILLVEDNPDDELLTVDALRHGGVDSPIAVARDGAEALEYLFGDPQLGTEPRDAPRLVLLDVKLPKINGHEVLRRIRADARTRRVPVVILTSSGEESDLVRGYENGANSYIQKPVEFDHFIDVVKTLGVYWLLFNRVPQD